MISMKRSFLPLDVSRLFSMYDQTTKGESARRIARKIIEGEKAITSASALDEDFAKAEELRMRVTTASVWRLSPHRPMNLHQDVTDGAEGVI